MPFHIVCYKENKSHFRPFLWIYLWKNYNSFTTSHTFKEILNLKYSVNHKTTNVNLKLLLALKEDPLDTWFLLACKQICSFSAFFSWMWTLLLKLKICSSPPSCQSIHHFVSFLLLLLTCYEFPQTSAWSAANGN